MALYAIAVRRVFCLSWAEQDRQCTYDVAMRHVRATIVAVEKLLSTTCSECVAVALGTQHAMRVRHVVIRGLSGSTIFFHMIS